MTPSACTLLTLDLVGLVAKYDSTPQEGLAALTRPEPDCRGFRGRQGRQRRLENSSKRTLT